MGTPHSVLRTEPRTSTARQRAAALGLALVLAGGCSAPSQGDASSAQADPPTTTTSSSTTTTTTAPPPPAPPIGAVPAAGLGEGDRGPQVAALEQWLTALHYDVAVVDDLFDADTGFAVVAFQKVANLPRTGRATQDVVDALTTATPPPPLVPDGGGNRIEVDLPRQVLFLYEGDALARILPVSTGSGERFCSDGSCRKAVTPGGAYRVGGRIPGWRESDLGRLYNPVYIDFKNGIAIHGYREVPPEPASHGCIRIPMSAAEWFFERVPDGTPVYVLDGTTPPAALGPPPAVPGETPSTAKP